MKHIPILFFLLISSCANSSRENLPLEADQVWFRDSTDFHSNRFIPLTSSGHIYDDFVMKKLVRLDMAKKEIHTLIDLNTLDISGIDFNKTRVVYFENSNNFYVNSLSIIYHVKNRNRVTKIDIASLVKNEGISDIYYIDTSSKYSVDTTDKNFFFFLLSQNSDITKSGYIAKMNLENEREIELFEIPIPEELYTEQKALRHYNNLELSVKDDKSVLYNFKLSPDTYELKLKSGEVVRHRTLKTDQIQQTLSGIRDPKVSFTTPVFSSQTQQHYRLMRVRTENSKKINYFLGIIDSEIEAEILRPIQRGISFINFPVFESSGIFFSDSSIPNEDEKLLFHIPWSEIHRRIP